MRLRHGKMGCAVLGIGLTTLVFLSISSGLSGSVAFADENSHYHIALQLVNLTYNEQVMYEAARRGALLAVTYCA